MSESARGRAAADGILGRVMRTASRLWTTLHRADAELLLSLLVVVSCVYLFHEVGESMQYGGGGHKNAAGFAEVIP